MYLLKINNILSQAEEEGSNETIQYWTRENYCIAFQSADLLDPAGLLDLPDGQIDLNYKLFNHVY